MVEKPAGEPLAPPPDPEPGQGPPPDPEVQPPSADPVRRHVTGDEPVPTRSDPRLSVDFF